MYRGRVQAEPAESKLSARRYVGSLLDLNPATLRNGVEDAERREGSRAPATRVVESEEVRALRRRTSSCAGRTRSSRQRRHFRQAKLDRNQVIVDYIDSYRGRFGVEPICAVLSEHGVPIAPSTHYAHRARPVSAAALEEAYTRTAESYRPAHRRRAPQAPPVITRRNDARPCTGW